MKRVIVQVKTKQRENTVIEGEPGKLSVKTTTLPIDGKANKSVIDLLAKYFSIPKNKVVIKSGAGSKLKTVEVDVD